MSNPVNKPIHDAHLENVAANLQLVADLAYADMALATPLADGSLVIVADAHPATAVAPIATSRVGMALQPDEEPEAYAALQGGSSVPSGEFRVIRGIAFDAKAFSVGDAPASYGVIIQYRALQVTASPGTMEMVFMEAAADIIDALRSGPLLDARTSQPFSTVRRAGDGVMRVDESGRISYASPNAVNILRLAGVTGSIVGRKSSALPGGGYGVAPVLGATTAIAVEVQVAERVLAYRAIGLGTGAVVLFEDRTEACRREAEIEVKQTTIREVHHRVKNNLQTIASLLRIQARRTHSEETRDALFEAVERVSSMAVVHDMLATSDEERIDFADAATKVVELVHRGLVGADSHVKVIVQGSTGMVEAPAATSLALALAELVHNAIEHGLGEGCEGTVEVRMRRLAGELVFTVRDDGRGLPVGFDLASSSNLGLAIVRTVVEDDLRGTLGFSGVNGTTVTVRIPLADER